MQSSEIIGIQVTPPNPNTPFPTPPRPLNSTRNNYMYMFFIVRVTFNFFCLNWNLYSTLHDCSPRRMNTEEQWQHCSRSFRRRKVSVHFSPNKTSTINAPVFFRSFVYSLLHYFFFHFLLHYFFFHCLLHYFFFHCLLPLFLQLSFDPISTRRHVV